MNVLLLSGLAGMLRKDAFGNALGSSLAEQNSGAELTPSERRNLDYDDPQMVALRAQNPITRSTYQRDPMATITSDEIATWHGANPQELLDGLPAVKFAPRTYTVQRGDNPASIGNQFFGDERAGAAILAGNGLSASVKGARGLQVGQVLTIPDDISDMNLQAGARLIGADNALRVQAAQQREAELRDRLYNDPDSFRFKSMRDRAASDTAEMAALQREAEIARANGPQLRAWDGVVREDPGTAYLRSVGALDVRGSSFHYQQSQSLSEAIVNEAGGVVVNTGLKLLNPGLQMLKGSVLSEQTLLRMELNGAMQSGLNADFRIGSAIGGLDADVLKMSRNSDVLQFEMRSSASVNQSMIAAGDQPAWLANTDVIRQIVPTGTQYNMVVSEAQAKALVRGESWFGGWATPDAVTSQAFARNNLSILPEFKPDVSYVARVETTAPQMVNSGFAGPLGGYKGTGAQVEFLGGKNLRIVGQPQILPRK